ncbi:class I SAM-dependent methyltransferase [Anaerosporobacter sp.]|uniref:class I SAM-dependent methyltransferase n=1 Tax=Anaerosporobacter sp. TaxID=1872529 RepID=UPI00286EF35E|nr:class I SAM-dependent methyltransferase [Anaerosporobacter sp.]
MNSKLFYNMTAKIYDILDKTYFADYNKSPRKVVMQSINTNDYVLDICTGTATNAINISKNNNNVKIIGIDLSDSMLAMARQKMQNEHITNVELLNMDATKLSFDDNTFDKILISLVLHELDEPIANQILEQAKCVLKDNGEIIITEWELSKNILRRFLFLPIHLFEPKSYRKFIKKDLNQYFKELGFNVTEVAHCNYSRVLKLIKT